MKYVRCVTNQNEQEDDRAFMMFEPSANHKAVLMFMRDLNKLQVTIQKEAVSAGFLRFNKEGHKTFSYSESLGLDAMVEDGGLIFQHLLEKGGDFVVHPLGDVVIVSKGVLDNPGVDAEDIQEIRGSFEVSKGEQGYLELLPKLSQAYFPKGSRFNEKQVVGMIYNIVNCDVL